jgi:hypothetical protein
VLIADFDSKFALEKWIIRIVEAKIQAFIIGMLVLLYVPFPRVIIESIVN